MLQAKMNSNHDALWMIVKGPGGSFRFNMSRYRESMSFKFPAVIMPTKQQQSALFKFCILMVKSGGAYGENMQKLVERINQFDSFAALFTHCMVAPVSNPAKPILASKADIAAVAAPVLAKAASPGMLLNMPKADFDAMYKNLSAGQKAALTKRLKAEAAQYAKAEAVGV